MKVRNVTSDVAQGFLGGIDMTATVNRETLSQWFTAPGLAYRAARWAVELVPWSEDRVFRILEPAAGDGALVRELLGCVGLENGPVLGFDVHEIDPYYVARLRSAFAPHAGVRVIDGDFLTAVRPPYVYDVVLQNPPYEGGLDGLFLEGSMNIANGVVGIFRTASLQGDARCKRVWRRLRPGGEWVMSRLALLENRPDFIGSGAVDSTGGARSEFCVVQMRRRQPHDPHHVHTALEWW